jgi:adenylate cyclase
MIWRWTALAAILVLLVAVVFGVWKFYLKPDVEPASKEKMAYPLPDKPSIAVLPFVNMSGDESDKYIADGLSENIISSLSKIPDMLVIARNSTFVYKGKAVKVSQVAEELGVRYVLEGGIQKSGNDLRVTAQLVDAIKGHHLWSERYDKNTKNFFAVQDDITRKIVIALQVELTEGDQARIVHDTENLAAWGYVTKAYVLMQLYTKDKNARARELYKQAVKLDPNYAIAYVGIAWTHSIDCRYGFSGSPSESLKRCVEFAQKAATLDNTLPEVHSVWNLIYLFQRQHDKAIAEGKKAVALGPSDSACHFLLALTLHFAGRFEESIFHMKEAMRLDPYYPTGYLSVLGHSYCMAGEHKKAIEALEEEIKRAKFEGGQRVNNHTRLIHALVELGRMEAAKEQAAKVLNLDPNFSLENWQKTLFYKDRAVLDRHLQALRKAGLK